MQIYVFSHVLVLYGNVGVKCHLLSSVVFEVAGFERMLINYKL